MVILKCYKKPCRGSTLSKASRSKLRVQKWHLCNSLGKIFLVLQLLPKVGLLCNNLGKIFLVLQCSCYQQQGFCAIILVNIFQLLPKLGLLWCNNLSKTAQIYSVVTIYLGRSSRDTLKFLLYVLGLIYTVRNLLPNWHTYRYVYQALQSIYITVPLGDGQEKQQ